MTYPSEFELIEMERNAYGLLAETYHYDPIQAGRDILRLVALIRAYQDRQAAA